MPNYIARRRTWLSHENRMVDEGEKFSTTFPLVGGKPMRLSDNVDLVSGSKKKEDTKDKNPDGDQDGASASDADPA